MTILLTGASGFVGSRVAARLDALGVDWEGLACRLETLAPKSLVYPIVIHCAGALRKRQDQLTSANVEGTAALVRALHSGARIVFVSSRSVYPCNGHELVHEGAAVAPWDEYGVSKLAAEQVLFSSAHRVVVVRAGGIFGHPLRTGNFIDRAVDLAMSGEPISLATPSRLEDYVAVDWLADTLVRLALTGEMDGEVLHAAGLPRSLDDIVDAIGRALVETTGRSARINYVDLPIPPTPVLAPGRLLQLPGLEPLPADQDVFTGMIRARQMYAQEGFWRANSR